MAKRSDGGLWLVIGGILLIALVPKEVWIALGVIAGVAAAVYVAVKLYDPKKPPVSTTPISGDPEPTLAEWMASNPKAQPSKPKPSPPQTSGSARALASPIVPRRTTVSEASDERDGIPQIALDTDVARARTTRDDDVQTPTAPAALSSGTGRIPGQPEEWNATRQSVVDTNRERAGALRGKFPPYPTLLSERETILKSNAAAQPPRAIPARPTSQPVPPLPLTAPSPFTSSEAKAEGALGNLMRVLRGAAEPEPMYSAGAATKAQPVHAIPAAPDGFRETRWFRPGETVHLAGLTLPGGMLYVGPKMTAPNGRIEPALINPKLGVASQGDFRESHTNYWPSYAEISPTARRAYLRWLAEGRSHPECDIGLVFLFFYGLERRVFIDSQQDEGSKGDWPAILSEIRRLLSIYGDKSSSFKRYGSELLNWLELDGSSSRLYEKPVPNFPRTYEVPPYIRLALGQAAVDRKPLPAALALSWLRLSPDCYLRTAATRCPEEFERLFAQRYHELLGDGLVLPKNRTKLKFIYQAASGGLHGSKISMGFNEVPDATALTAPIKALREIAEQCTDELGSYSRLVGKDRELAGSLEGLLLLPASLWPPAAQARLRALTIRMRNGRLSLPLRELLSALGGATQKVSREVMRALARALEGEQIGMEPNVLAGARTPGADDLVVLFSQPASDASAGSSVEFQTGALTLQLAAAMAMADGEFNAKEVEHLRGEIERWDHLTPAERTRLHAHLQWLTSTPPTLASLKKKLEPLSLGAREAIAASMANLAQSDGFVSPDEVKFLEKIYKALGVEAKRVFIDVHAASSGGAPSPNTKTGKGGFRLDADRIAALEADTLRVSALLSTIFNEESAPAAGAPEPEPIAENDNGSLLGLDEAHAALLRLMMSRPSWTRSELEDAAADLELMLDGALEEINEAAFDLFDAPLCEGDDPVDVNSELLERLEA